jgi:iron complex outermembrane receptor protein
VVVTGTAFDADVAPAKASLETTEPQTIINRSYIEDSVSGTADYTTILAIAPSMTGIDLNGPGLSDGGVKNTMRGIADGNYGITFDGIPFGDSNGPSHHSESYFPSSTIGSIDVDRGPGNAGNMGAATYGGSINMFSEDLTIDPRGRVRALAGSSGTSDFNVNYQTGDLDLGGRTTRALVNFQDTNSSGYLTLQSTAHQNYLVKTQTEIAPGWTLTAFGNFNGLFQNLNDNAGETAAEIVSFGKRFALQNTNNKAGTFADFNHVHKKTDMDYLRLQGEMAGGIQIDNTFYTYAYVNKTQTALTVAQTAADIAAGITETNGTIVNGVSFKNDVPGYTKQNAFRMWGDILRLSKDFDFGWLTGQVRTGVWWEDSASQRRRYDYDATQCQAAGCNPWKTQQFADSRLNTGQKTPTSLPFAGGFYEYEEHSNWSEYQPFVELELHPTEDFTITPGFKYVWWHHAVNAPIEQKTKPSVPVVADFDTSRDLPFLTVNYKLQPSWSVYGQYAQGIYVPDISSFEQGTPQALIPGTTHLLVPPKAQTTTNYQLGTVFYADNFTIDGDIYYIGVDNNISFQACNLAPIFGPSGFTCSVNTGKAFYKGIEGETTYAFEGPLQGLVTFLNASLISGKSGTRADGLGAWLKQVPMWTAATGATYKIGGWKLSLIDKLVGQQYSDNADTKFYKLPTYNVMDFKGSYSAGGITFELAINNLLNSQNIAAIGITDKTTVGASIYDYAGRGASLDQYSFQPSRFFEGSIKVAF